MKFIHAKINHKTGELTVKTEGFEGAECLEHPAVKKMEEDLGLEGTVEHTPEFYQEQQVNQQQNLGGS